MRVNDTRLSLRSLQSNLLSLLLGTETCNAFCSSALNLNKVADSTCNCLAAGVIVLLLFCKGFGSWWQEP